LKGKNLSANCRRGDTLEGVSAVPKRFADFTAQGESEIWNIQISDRAWQRQEQLCQP